MSPFRAMLDFPGTGRQAFAEPHALLVAELPDEVPDVLHRAEAAARDGAWVVGFVAYEAAPAFDSALQTRAHEGPAPLACFGVFDAPAVPADADVANLTMDWQTHTSRAEYDVAIRTIREAIAAGDVYQVNHTLRFRAPCDVPPQLLYDTLSRARHGVYHALLETAEWAIVSASPELFFDLRDGVVTTRPMKGTIRRGRWLAEDEQARATLAASPKDRAENLMIVDLLRNDLGRVAEFGSVRVERLFDIETYPTVHQMTSTITGALRRDVTVCDVFAAMFPCGSVTGAPKFTAMQSIAALEDAPRGAYCGAIGVLRPDGSATFNVGIRTVVIDRAAQTAVYGAGGGITWDSSAAAELDEVIAKAALLTERVPEFELLETMRCDDGVIRRLDLHMQRLADSAQYWSFAPDAASRARAALERTLQSLGSGAHRVRLTVARAGASTIECTPLRHEPGDVQRAVIADAPVSSSDRMLFHKTTARALYDSHRAAHPDAFDVLLYNEHGAITEFTIGNVVIELDGALVTPPLTCGLLAGTFRAQLLRDGIIGERAITVDEVRRASRVWLINSVREWVEVRLG